MSFILVSLFTYWLHLDALDIHKWVTTLSRFPTNLDLRVDTWTQSRKNPRISGSHYGADVPIRSTWVFNFFFSACIGPLSWVSTLFPSSSSSTQLCGCSGIPSGDLLHEDPCKKYRHYQLVFLDLKFVRCIICSIADDAINEFSLSHTVSSRKLLL